MFNWAKQQLANVAGTQEPIYGPSAIQPVSKQTEKTPYTELSRSDHAWKIIDSTCVETQCFYFMAESGHVGFAEILYSNVAGIRITSQFVSKIFYPPSENKPHLFCSDQLNNLEFSDDKCSLFADNLAVDLSEDGTTYTIKSMTNEQCIVNVTVKRVAPAIVIGENGTSTYGTDSAKPWGSMRHAFWSQATVEGSMITKDGPVEMKGKAMLSHALQGMKPHHAAATWNFVDFQTPNYAAIMMEFTTPPSYGSTKVNVGAIVKNGEVLFAGTTNTATHTAVHSDEENSWPEPSAAKFVWHGKTKDGKDAEAVLEGQLGKRTDRIDVMAEVPGFVKTIVAAAAGTKPYIYQYINEDLTLKVKTGEEEASESGKLFMEATFITDPEGKSS